MERTIALIGRPFSHRRMALCVTQFIIVGFIALSSVSDAGAEKPYPLGQTSQQFFVTNCRGNGGTTKRLESRVVECTLPNDYKIVCNWKSGLCKDFPPKQRLTRPASYSAIDLTAAGARNSVSLRHLS